jgi:hypothetical protein
MKGKKHEGKREGGIKRITNIDKKSNFGNLALVYLISITTSFL